MVFVEVLEAFGIGNPIAGGFEVVAIVVLIYVIAKAFIDKQK